MKSALLRSVLALATIGLVAGMGVANAQQKDRPLKKYESGTKEFWTHPPDDWFLGDQTETQEGFAPPSGPPTGASETEPGAPADRCTGSRARRAGQKDQVAAGLQDRGLGTGRAARAADGVSRQGHAFR